MGCGKSSLLAALLGELQPLPPPFYADAVAQADPPGSTHRTADCTSGMVVNLERSLPVAAGRVAIPNSALPASLPKASETSGATPQSGHQGQMNQLAQGGQAEHSEGLDAAGCVEVHLGAAEEHLGMPGGDTSSFSDLDPMDLLGPIIRGSMAYCSQVGGRGDQ